MTNTNTNYPVGSFAEIGDDFEEKEISPLEEYPDELTEEQYGYDRALIDLMIYTKAVTADESENRAFIVSAIKYLRKNYKDG